MIPSNLVEISGEVFTFSADVGLFDAYVFFELSNILNFFTRQ